MKLLALAAMLVATSSAVAPETLAQARVIRAEASQPASTRPPPPLHPRSTAVPERVGVQDGKEKTVKLLALAAMLVATSSAVAPETLAQARVIRAEVGAKYRLVPGRKLSVTEATSTAVVESITLITDWLEPPRVVPAGDGIYFAICSARATCPYPRRSAAWRPLAFQPRRLAVELALRTFLETSAGLVVVALPTGRPVWLVFERDDLLAAVDAQMVLEQLGRSPAFSDKPLREIVDRLTRPRLFAPLLGLPPPDDTIYAARLVVR